MNLRAWFADRALATRAVLVVAAAVIAVNAALYAARLVAGGVQPGGVTASAHATAAGGFAGWADLLRGAGSKVVLLDQHLADAQLPDGATVIIAEPQGFTADDDAAVTQLLASGGRVVLVGSSSASLLRTAGVASVNWTSASAGRVGVLAPAPEVHAVTAVSAGGGGYEGIGPLLAILGTPERAEAVVGQAGPGRVVAVASTEVFDNAHLGELDNAAFALAAAGGPGRSVYFDEADHGYGPSSGLAALPSGWKWAAAAALLAAMVGLWTRGKRLGPPEDLERPLAPPRRLHVDALASALARSRDAAGVGARLRASVRSQLSRASGIAVDDPRFVAAARDRAAAAGVPEAELDTLTEAPAADGRLLALGSVAARLSRTPTRSRPTAPGGPP